jgi:hypothetical protein
MNTAAPHPDARDVPRMVTMTEIARVLRCLRQLLREPAFAGALVRLVSGKGPRGSARCAALRFTLSPKTDEHEE